jgi:hypothetical protein
MEGAEERNDTLRTKTSRSVMSKAMVSDEKFVLGAVRGLQPEDCRDVLGFLCDMVRVPLLILVYMLRQK